MVLSVAGYLGESAQASCAHVAQLTINNQNLVSEQMIRVALTGGIASGKTTVSDRFSTLGVPVVDADLLSRKAVEANSPGLQQIAERFGTSILQADGTLDRAKLRSIIFEDEKARADLEAIVHPEVRRLTDNQIRTFEQAAHLYCLVVIPLLVETGQQERYDHVIVVDVAKEVQLQRLQARDGSSTAEANKILASQANRDERLAIADSIITNNADIESINEQVHALHKKLIALAQRQPS